MLISTLYLYVIFNIDYVLPFKHFIFDSSESKFFRISVLPEISKIQHENKILKCKNLSLNGISVLQLAQLDRKQKSRDSRLCYQRDKTYRPKA